VTHELREIGSWKKALSLSTTTTTTTTTTTKTKTTTTTTSLHVRRARQWGAHGTVGNNYYY
jgi:hypothetical protein